MKDVDLLEKILNAAELERQKLAMKSLETFLSNALDIGYLSVSDLEDASRQEALRLNTLSIKIREKLVEALHLVKKERIRELEREDAALLEEQRKELERYRESEKERITKMIENLKFSLIGGPEFVQMRNDVMKVLWMEVDAIRKKKPVQLSTDDVSMWRKSLLERLDRMRNLDAEFLDAQKENAETMEREFLSSIPEDTTGIIEDGIIEKSVEMFRKQVEEAILSLREHLDGHLRSSEERMVLFMQTLQEVSIAMCGLDELVKREEMTLQNDLQDSRKLHDSQLSDLEKQLQEGQSRLKSSERASEIEQNYQNVTEILDEIEKEHRSFLEKMHQILKVGAENLMEKAGESADAVLSKGGLSRVEISSLPQIDENLPSTVAAEGSGEMEEKSESEDSKKRKAIETRVILKSDASQVWYIRGKIEAGEGEMEEKGEAISFRYGLPEPPPPSLEEIEEEKRRKQEEEEEEAKRSGKGKRATKKKATKSPSGKRSPSPDGMKGGKRSPTPPPRGKKKMTKKQAMEEEAKRLEEEAREAEEKKKEEEARAQYILDPPEKLIPGVESVPESFMEDVRQSISIDLATHVDAILRRLNTSFRESCSSSLAKYEKEAEAVLRVHDYRKMEAVVSFKEPTERHVLQQKRKVSAFVRSTQDRTQRHCERSMEDFEAQLTKRLQSFSDANESRLKRIEGTSKSDVLSRMRKDGERAHAGAMEGLDEDLENAKKSVEHFEVKMVEYVVEVQKTVAKSFALNFETLKGWLGKQREETSDHLVEIASNKRKELDELFEEFDKQCSNHVEDVQFLEKLRALNLEAMSRLRASTTSSQNDERNLGVLVDKFSKIVRETSVERKELYDLEELPPVLMDLLQKIADLSYRRGLTLETLKVHFRGDIDADTVQSVHSVLDEAIKSLREQAAPIIKQYYGKTDRTILRTSHIEGTEEDMQKRFEVDYVSPVTNAFQSHEKSAAGMLQEQLASLENTLQDFPSLLFSVIESFAERTAMEEISRIVASHRPIREKSQQSRLSNERLLNPSLSAPSKRDVLEELVSNESSRCDQSIEAERLHHVKKQQSLDRITAHFNDTYSLYFKKLIRILNMTVYLQDIKNGESIARGEHRSLRQLMREQMLQARFRDQSGDRNERGFRTMKFSVPSAIKTTSSPGMLADGGDGSKDERGAGREEKTSTSPKAAKKKPDAKPPAGAKGKTDAKGKGDAKPTVSLSVMPDDMCLDTRYHRSLQITCDSRVDHFQQFYNSQTDKSVKESEKYVGEEESWRSTWSSMVGRLKGENK
eukprot:TRINITY_DN23844_c0_g2_i1.p1 TRINITY_DN23844_c0_g2~~TRINITY_DN23844_c0_g2_i1.p1  ORF type:complete len:1491 (+),score=507.17 TRINITY_DN23844_c0_g2_i1:628-4473(+)